MEMKTELSVAQKTILTQQFCQSLQLLNMEQPALAEYLYRQQIENPMLEIVSFPTGGKVSLQGRRSTVNRSDDGEDMPDPFYNTPAPESLAVKLYKQVNIAALGDELLKAVKLLLNNLDDDGYLSVPLAELAQVCGAPEKLLAQALEVVQQLDPPGVGARNLGECLCLQLRRKGCEDPLLYEIARSHLEALSKGQYRQIGKALGISGKRTAELCAVIQGLRPRPITFHQEPQYAVPDIIVQETGEGLEVQVNDDYLPKLRISEEYRAMAAKAGDVGEFLAPYEAKAEELFQSLELRQTTLRVLAKAVVAHQAEFFRSGADVVPLTRTEIAEELDLSVSTVSRAVQNKFLWCERGTFPLAHFFTYAVGDGSTAATAREQVTEILRAQPGLSDQAVADLLSRRGISLSRRTVAKYRSQLRIPSLYVRSLAERGEEDRREE